VYAIFGQICDVDQIPFGHHARMPEHILKFPDISGPEIPGYNGLGSAGERLNVLPRLQGQNNPGRISVAKAALLCSPRVWEL
jgi:hypothetical protein